METSGSVSVGTQILAEKTFPRLHGMKHWIEYSLAWTVFLSMKKNFFTLSCRSLHFHYFYY